MTTLVKWMGKGCGDLKELDKSQKAAIGFVTGVYKACLRKFGITTYLPLYIVDEGMWKHLKMHPKSVAHYNKGISYTGVKRHKAILLRGVVLLWDDVGEATPFLIQHELIHVKLGNKERGNEHGKPFRDLAKKYKLPLTNPY